MTDDPLPDFLLVAGDVRLFRDALAITLTAHPGFSLVGTADSCENLLAILRSRTPDLVVFDASMAGALDLVRACARTHPTLRFVAVAVTETEHDVIACAEAGVAGYVPREGSVDDLVKTLIHVQRGEILCPPSVTGSLFRRLAALAAAQFPPAPAAAGALTQREGEIATLLDSGLSNKEIARRLRIEVATVKNHVHNILEKLHVRRRGEAAAVLRSSASRYFVATRPEPPIEPHPRI
jgi:two-component system, NarL family, nitrate/nitrite response regulator NarL